MKRDDIKRNKTSEALIALRKAMGMTQQRFAVEVLGSSIVTVARYESRYPPEGGGLLLFGQIADENGLPDLGQTFLALYLEEVHRKVGCDMVIVPETDASIIHGFMPRPIEGYDELLSVQLLAQVWDALHSSVEPRRRIAAKTLAALNAGARDCIDPTAFRMIHQFTFNAKHGPPEADAVVPQPKLSPPQAKTPITTKKNTRRIKK